MERLRDDMLVDVDDALHDKIKKMIEKKNVDFPTIRHFVNQAVKEKLVKEGGPDGA